MVIRKIFLAAVSSFVICGATSLDAMHKPFPLIDFMQKPRATLCAGKCNKGEFSVRLEGSTTILQSPGGIANNDITQYKVDAIVNPANSMLQHGGGVAAAISKAAGPKLQEWSDEVPMLKICLDPSAKYVRLKYACLPIGHAMISPSFDLAKNNIRAIIHTVGPNPCADEDQKENADKYLYDAWYNALKVASGDERIKTIAFPSISTGIFGFPLKRASEIAIKAIIDFIQKNPHRFEKIILVLWPDTAQDYRDAVEAAVEPISGQRISESDLQD